MKMDQALVKFYRDKNMDDVLCVLGAQRESVCRVLTSLHYLSFS